MGRLNRETKMTYENYSMHQTEINGRVDRFYVPKEVKDEPFYANEYQPISNLQRPGRAPKVPDVDLKPDELAARELKRKRNREAAKRVRQRRVQKVADLERQLDQAKKELDNEKTANEKLRKQLQKLQQRAAGQDQNEMVQAFRRLSANDNTQNHPHSDVFYGLLSPTFQLIASPLTTAANMPNPQSLFPYPENDGSHGEQTKPTYTQLLG